MYNYMKIQLLHRILMNGAVVRALSWLTEKDHFKWHTLKSFGSHLFFIVKVKNKVLA